jgi:hypothetical protein
MHAWLFKDNPLGMFAPTHPNVSRDGFDFALLEKPTKMMPGHNACCPVGGHPPRRRCSASAITTASPLFSMQLLGSCNKRFLRINSVSEVTGGGSGIKCVPFQTE